MTSWGVLPLGLHLCVLFLNGRFIVVWPHLNNFFLVHVESFLFMSSCVCVDQSLTCMRWRYVCVSSPSPQSQAFIVRSYIPGFSFEGIPASLLAVPCNFSVHASGNSRSSNRESAGGQSSYQRFENLKIKYLTPQSGWCMVGMR